MNKKYIALLVTVFLLVSCGEKDSSDWEKTNKLPEASNEILEEINEEIETLEEPEAEETQPIPTEENIEKEFDESDEIEVPTVPDEVPAETDKATAESDETLPSEPAETEPATSESDEVLPSEPAEVMEEEPIKDPAPAAEEDTQTKVIELNQTYASPAGDENVRFTINLSGDTIESVSTAAIGVENNISQARIDAFGAAINSAISWKTLEEAKNIGVVGGSSLTTDAFTAAIKGM